MDIKNLTRDEQIKLYYQLEKALGWYGIVTLCVEDVKQYVEDNQLSMPSDERIRQACAYVSRKNDESSYPFIEWALEVVDELNQQEQS
jgi:hypothetical protein